MASHIALNNSTLATNIRSTIALQRAALEAIRRIKTICDTYVSGSDYTALEAALGLSTGQGVTVYNYFVNSKAVIDVLTVTAMLDNLQD